MKIDTGRGGYETSGPRKDDAVTHGLRPKILFYFTLALALAVSVFSYFKDDGFRNIFKTEKKILSEKELLKRVKEENELLKYRIKTAREDPHNIEKLAREKLNMVGKDDLVFRFYEDGSRDIGSEKNDPVPPLTAPP
ncbi:MAG: septum formation initiator family protein [Nitrospinota bacterium]|nr:septum formation initiator family protein [Nitrospinota bacterium]